MAWFRWYEGATNDPKFQWLARKSGQPAAFALALWAMLLERASSAKKRGDISGFDCESADAALGFPDGTAQTIFDLMVEKGLISENRISKWEERQPKKEDETATQRSRDSRERKKEEIKNSSGSTNAPAQGNAAQHDATQCNNMQRNATQGNAAQHDATLDKIRVDKNIKEIKSIKACAESQATSTQEPDPPPQKTPSLLPEENKKPDPCVIEFPIDGDPKNPFAKIFQSDVEKWQGAYPSLDVMQELREMLVWLEANASRKKTRGGIRRFVVNWLGKSQNQGRGGIARASPKTFAELEEEREEKRRQERYARAMEYDRQKNMGSQNAANDF